MSVAQKEAIRRGRPNNGGRRPGPLYGINLKTEAIRIYGGSCECCAESEHDFLTFDHVDGGGTAKRQSGEDHTNKLYRRIVKAAQRLPGYRLLCWNCNWASRLGRICPHQRFHILKIA